VTQQRADRSTRRSSSVSVGVLDGATANSLAAYHHGPLQDDQAVKTKLLTGSCLRFWTRAWAVMSMQQTIRALAEVIASCDRSVKGRPDVPAVQDGCSAVYNSRDYQTAFGSATSRTRAGN
jgi:hypothetical protein